MMVDGIGTWGGVEQGLRHATRLDRVWRIGRVGRGGDGGFGGAWVGTVGSGLAGDGPERGRDAGVARVGAAGVRFVGAARRAVGGFGRRGVCHWIDAVLRRSLCAGIVWHAVGDGGADWRDAADVGVVAAVGLGCGCASGWWAVVIGEIASREAIHE